MFRKVNRIDIINWNRQTSRIDFPIIIQSEWLEEHIFEYISNQ